MKGLDLEDLDAVLAKLDLDRSVPPVSHRFKGGTREAKRLLHKFLTAHLPEYEESRPHPETTHVSHMSKYPLFHDSIGPSARVTSSVGYVRVHGRNYRNWFRKTANAMERYDYLFGVQVPMRLCRHVSCRWAGL